MTTVLYTHSPGEEVEFLAGSYTIDQEVRLPFNGGEVLYLVGSTSVISSCCGTASPFNFIKVVGAVLAWQDGRDARDRPTSKVEAVRDEPAQAKLRELISSRHPGIDQMHIEFW